MCTGTKDLKALTYNTQDQQDVCTGKKDLIALTYNTQDQKDVCTGKKDLIALTTLRINRMCAQVRKIS